MCPKSVYRCPNGSMINPDNTYIVQYLKKEREPIKFGQIREYKIRDTRETNSRFTFIF